MNEEFVKLCVNESYWKHSGDFVKNAYDPKYNQGGKYDEKAANKDMDLNVVLCLEMKEEGTAFKIEKHVLAHRQARALLPARLLVHQIDGEERPYV